MERFLKAQGDGVYERALAEIKAGEKQSHWMWFIFPQLFGLGFSYIAEKYEIKSFEEAKEYISDKTLRERLLEISEAVYELNAENISNVLGYPDDLKFLSCMTLFSLISPEYPIFQKNIDRYFEGKGCEYTTEKFREYSETLI